MLPHCQPTHHRPLCRVPRPAAASSAPPLLLALLGSLLLLGGGAEAWSDCSSGPTLFKVEDVALTPEPVHPGDTAHFLITADSGAYAGRWCLPGVRGIT